MTYYQGGNTDQKPIDGIIPGRPGKKAQNKQEQGFYFIESGEPNAYNQNGQSPKIKPIVGKNKPAKLDLRLINNLQNYNQPSAKNELKLEFPKPKISNHTDFVSPQKKQNQTEEQYHQEIYHPKKSYHSPKIVSISSFVFKPLIIIALTVLVVFGIGSGTLYSQTNNYDLLSTAYKTSSNIKNKSDDFKNLQIVLNELLGQKSAKRYMILFMNPAEARPASGFSGNFGMIGFDKGKITEFWVKDIYSVRANMPKAEDPYSKAPSTSGIIFKHQKFSDANWYADFPLTAKNIQEVYSLYNGWETDGVISVDPYVFINLLKLIGPIEMPEYNTTFDEKSFWETMHFKIEIDNDFKKGKNKNESPKKILHDFVPKLLNKISQMPMDKKKEVIKMLYSDMQKKHAMIFFNDFKAEEAIKKIGFGGEIKNNNGDYLNVVKSNFENKSGYKVDQSIKLNSNLDNTGILNNELTITHKNNAGLKFPEGGHFSMLTIYVPKNAEFVSAYIGNTSVKPTIFIESEKKVFGFKDFNTPSGETNSIIIKYQVDSGINGTVNNQLSFLFQKQSGILSEDFEYNLTADQSWKLAIENHPANQENQYGFNGKIDNDWLLNISLER